MAVVIKADDLEKYLHEKKYVNSEHNVPKKALGSLEFASDTPKNLKVKAIGQ